MVVIFVIIFIIPSAFIFSSSLFLNTPIQADSNLPPEEENEENFDTFSPEISTPDFVGGTKNIVDGSQTPGYPWDVNNLLYNDSNHDSTTFGPGWYDDIAYQSATSIDSYTGAYGTNAAGLWPSGSQIDTALRSEDNNNLFLEATWGNNYGPAWIYLIWGSYSDLPSGAHTHVSKIRIYYEIWADSFAGVLDQSSNLRLYAFDQSKSNYQYKTIASTPGHQKHYESYWDITSGSVFNSVKAGGYIRYIGTYLYCNEEIWTFTWINTDYIDIVYYFDHPDVDFNYELDYGGYGLTTATGFDLVLDINETISGVNVHLYDFVNFEWDLKGSITSAGAYIFAISAEADNYFSGTDKLQVRFEKYDYFDERPYTDYRVIIDLISIDFDVPDPPSNVQVNQGILHVFLSWDIPTDNGMPITQYNVYRGTVQGGSKALLATPIVNEFNDTTAVVGTRYYYVISAENVVGESENSTEVSGRAYDAPFVEWLNPTDGDTVIFPYNKSDTGAQWIQFHFQYDWVACDDVKLIINAIDYGSVWGKNYTRFYPYLDGSVTATLEAYNQSILVASDTISLTFVRIVLEVTEMLDFNTTILGKQLYLILHDPHGDNSYSHFEESTTLSMGVGAEITTSLGVSIEIGSDFELFGVEAGASLLLEAKMTAELGFDFRYEVTDTASLTSNKEASDPDYIGPGYGDAYWGESWIYKWVLNASYRVYSNGTDRYEDPKLRYGILRGVETIANDQNAPENWRMQNAVHNSSIPVDWVYPVLWSNGGFEYTKAHEVTTTETRKQSFEIALGLDARVKLGIVETHLTIETSVKTYAEVEQGHTYIIDYFIYDDDPSDKIVQGRGIDRRFGTYIFNTSSFFCESSNPYEHGTFDYVPPDIDFPDIELDSDNDGYGPTPLDSPIVTVDILDEGGIQEAIIWYSIDNGSSWNIAFLSEQPANPGTWSGAIPAQPIDTFVLWYIEAWDLQGSNSTRKDNFGNPFEYTVIAKPSKDEAIPGYPPLVITAIMLVTIVSIIVILHKKYWKFRK